VTLKALFSWKWIVPTILVVLGMIMLARLGIWQWDRLQQKRAFNTIASERWHQAPFDLNAAALPADLAELEYRRVAAEGAFDYGRQILISNQVFNSTAGYVIVTPLVLEDNRAVLVARGWLPPDQADPALLPQHNEAAGVPVVGLIRASQAPRTGAASTPVALPQREWYRIDIPAIQGQMPYPLERAYVEQLPEEGRTYDQLPLRLEPMALDEGNHLSYSIQWFTFALVLGFGYIMLVRHQTRRAAGLDGPPASRAVSAMREPSASEPAAVSPESLAGNAELHAQPESVLASK